MEAPASGLRHASLLHCRKARLLRVPGGAASTTPSLLWASCSTSFPPSVWAYAPGHLLPLKTPGLSPPARSWARQCGEPRLLRSCCVQFTFRCFLRAGSRPCPVLPANVKGASPCPCPSGPEHAGLLVAVGALPFRLLPIQRLPIQRPSQKKQTRHPTDASASGCPPLGH